MPNDTLKIAVWYNFQSGGAKRALYHQVRGLVEHGHHVESWCTPSCQDGYLPFDDIVAKEHVIPVRNWSSLLGKLEWRIEAGKRKRAIDDHCRVCAQQIDEGGFEVVLVNSCMYQVVSSIGRHLKTPSVLYLPEPRRWLYEAHLTAGKAARMQGIAFFKAITAILTQAERSEEIELAKQYDLILVNSLYSRESILRAYGLESKVCYLGIDAALFHSDEAERGDYVLGLGEIDERKGLDRAIRAIATIDEDRRPRLVWVGNRGVASYQSYSEALADSLGVTFEPKILVSDTELRALLSGAIAMIYTSRLEPFGLAPLEAGACSVPVVAIAEGGVRETVFDRVNGLLSPHDDPVLIGSLISELVSDPSLAQSLGKRGRELVLERWDWDRSVSELETHLHKVIKQTMRENIQPIESP